jgi:drug/metabolite transporter (DMT)-like permease
MANTTVIERAAGAASKRFDIRVLLAFFAIYFLWGTTFLAIRIAVQEVPPLFAAGTRFFVAGAVLYGFMRFRGAHRPTALQWRSLAVLALLMFVAEYGLLFWAQKYVPSGIASVFEATLPLITMALEVWIFRRQRYHWPLLAAILLGFCGVGLLLVHNAGQSFGNAEQSFGVLPSVAILAGAAAWSLVCRPG